MDASVLQAINDGYLLSNHLAPLGGGGEGWAKFFSEIKSGNTTQPELNMARLTAEQKGIDYSWSLKDVQSAYSNSSEYEKDYFDVFKTSADNYRKAGMEGGVLAGQIDPRAWGTPLAYMSHLLPIGAGIDYAAQQIGKDIQSMHPILK